MNCVLFAKMDQVFSKENKTLKKIREIGKKILEKSGNFVSPEKVGTLITVLQGSHSTWKTWKNESTPGKPGNIMEF